MPLPAIAAGAVIGAAKAAPHVAKAAKSISMNPFFKKLASQGVNPFKMVTHVGKKPVADKSGEVLKGKIDEYFFRRGLAGRKFPEELGKSKGLVDYYTQKGKEAAYRATMKSQRAKQALKKRAEEL